MTLLDMPMTSLSAIKSATSETSAVKQEVTAAIHALADAADWCHLDIPRKSKLYETWATDPDLGGRLAVALGPEKVHMYIKDTVMRAYHRSKRTSLEDLLKNMGVKHHFLVDSFEKPRGLLYDHTHLYTLTVAKEWRIAVTSAYERAALASENVERNVLLVTEHRVDRFLSPSYRALIEAAGQRLGVEVLWVT